MTLFFLLFLAGGFFATSFLMIQAGLTFTRRVFCAMSIGPRLRALVMLGVVLWTFGFLGCVAYVIAAIGVGMIEEDSPMHMTQLLDTSENPTNWGRNIA